MINAEMLTGRSTEHRAPLSGNHRLQPQAVNAFTAMQQAAREADSISSPPAPSAISTGS